MIYLTLTTILNKLIEKYIINMYINSTIIPLQPWMTSFVILPPFSKVLNISIRSGSMFIMYSSTTYDNKLTGGNSKTYNIRVLLGLEISNQQIPDGFKFLNTIKTIENDIVEYYHIFIDEVMSLSEIRDSKIDEVIN